MAEKTEKMECPTCGYKSHPQWLNDEAHCLKCQAVLKRRGGVHGTDRYDERFSPGAVADKDLRVSGEVSTYKESASSAMESVSGKCDKSPDGQCHWKFGKCSCCGKAEGKLVVPGCAAGECAKGGKCTMKFAKCSKCGRPEGGLAPRAVSPRPKSPNPAAGGLKPPSAAAGKAASPRGASPAAGSAQLKAPATGASPRGASPRGASPRPEAKAGSGGYSSAAGAPKAAGGDDRTKVECPSCGYKCIPQWLNDEAHCLKCQAVLKKRAGVHGYAADQPETRVTPGNVADKDRRAPGEASTYKESPGSAMESSSGVCPKSPDGAHHWKFGKCSYCQSAGGQLGKGGGATANPGGRGADCSKGGKCVFKFAKCSKCGGKEF